MITELRPVVSSWLVNKYSFEKGLMLKWIIVAKIIVEQSWSSPDVQKTFSGCWPLSWQALGYQNYSISGAWPRSIPGWLCSGSGKPCQNRRNRASGSSRTHPEALIKADRVCCENPWFVLELKIKRIYVGIWVSFGQHLIIGLIKLLIKNDGSNDICWRIHTKCWKPEEPWSNGQSGCLWCKRTWVRFQLRPNVFSLLGYKEVGIKWIQT